MILISHRMPDVFAVCDRVVVMRRGTKVADKADRRHLARGGHRPHHRRDPRRLSRRIHAGMPTTRPASTSVAIEDVTGLKERSARCSGCSRSQPFWVTVALLLICAVMSWLQPDAFATDATTSSTSPATSPSSASWRWA